MIISQKCIIKCLILFHIARKIAIFTVYRVYSIKKNVFFKELNKTNRQAIFLFKPLLYQNWRSSVLQILMQILSFLLFLQSASKNCLNNYPVFFSNVWFKFIICCWLPFLPTVGSWPTVSPGFCSSEVGHNTHLVPPETQHCLYKWMYLETTKQNSWYFAGILCILCCVIWCFVMLQNNTLMPIRMFRSFFAQFTSHNLMICCRFLHILSVPLKIPSLNCWNHALHRVYSKYCRHSPPQGFYVLRRKVSSKETLLIDRNWWLCLWFTNNKCQSNEKQFRAKLADTSCARTAIY